MADINAGKCPWTILGLPRTASEKDVRQAYRKQALKWHPDQNMASSEAKTKFHEIKEAFEEIKRRQFQGVNSNRRPHVTRRNEASYSGFRNRYTYADTNKSSYTNRNDSSFSGFRRDKTQSQSDFRGGYQDTTYMRRPPRGTTHESLRAIRARFRAMESIGIGVGILLVGSTIAAASLTGKLVWKRANRGKSFDELMRNLDDRPQTKKDNLSKRRKRSLDVNTNESSVPNNVEAKQGK